MKSLRFMLSVVLMSLTTVAFAQSDAQKSFDKIKTLAGSWEGHVTTVPPKADIEGKLMQVSLRATSMGNALMHEMTGAGRPDDPITMLYLDGDRLLLTHYCDAGNRPRMAGKMSPDGKTVEFDFLDVAGITPRTGRTWSQGTSRFTHTLTCSAPSDKRVSLAGAIWNPSWTVSGTTVSRFTAS